MGSDMTLTELYRSLNAMDAFYAALCAKLFGLSLYTGTAFMLYNTSFLDKVIVRAERLEKVLYICSPFSWLQKVVKTRGMQSFLKHAL